MQLTDENGNAMDVETGGDLQKRIQWWRLVPIIRSLMTRFGARAVRYFECVAAESAPRLIYCSYAVSRIIMSWMLETDGLSSILFAQVAVLLHGDVGKPLAAFPWLLHAAVSQCKHKFESENILFRWSCRCCGANGFLSQGEVYLVVSTISRYRRHIVLLSAVMLFA